MTKIIIFLLIFLFSSCINIANGESKKVESKTIKARITFYHPHQDKWGKLNACPNTKYSKEGITVAAHPDFKFGTKISIPELANIVGDGNFIVQDRGSAVTKKRASKGKFYVFDVYVSSPKKYRKLAYSGKLKEYMNVTITNTKK